ncbi:hypothetical protein K5X82_07040 [Halosquirtibacter xylanolyticus]|uniref:hypothetical protein n=1 Tax=Halosquirtibacter xylanolyticus TaxID=3374599 RepID=UPI00374A4668|nr:hypothetical protein K5X82_07040 [Prolixibacteraceae bacterium]
MSSVSLAAQEGALKSYFPNSIIKRIREKEITWTHDVTPSPLSGTYKIRLHYKMGRAPEVFVLEPKPLKLAEGQIVLKHVYSTPKQKLCLYYPLAREWSSSMYLANTIIPWACEWLLHYEIWAVTGVWNGGGIEHSSEDKK